MLRLAPLVAVFAAVAACRCQPPPTMQVEVNFRVEEKSLDFGRVLEGDAPTRSVHVTSTGQADQTLELTVTAPFSIDAGTVDLPGGSTVEVPVTFHAGNMPVTGVLTVNGQGNSPDAGIDVTLTGIGVHPKTCPTPTCRESHYDLASDSCVETVSPDGAMCTPTSTCLEHGQCLGGVCQGTARTCDDMNNCTTDGCAEGIGCVNTMIACPAPADPCFIATCNPNSGCGTGPAPEGTPCGSVDCVHANVCTGGHCITVPTPEGFPCSPPTPCQDQGHCNSGVCKRPDAGIMMPELVLPIGGAPPAGRPMLLSFASELFGEICALPVPVPDAGATDAGDAGDAGAADAGDGGADPTDGGTCALISYTSNGFERFTQKFVDQRERALLHIANKGAALLDADGGLELRSTATGSLIWRVELPGSVLPRGVASSAAGDPWAVVGTSDGGALLMRAVDGGVQPLADLGAPGQQLALDERGGAWFASTSAGTIGWLPGLNDGGIFPSPLWTASAPDAATATLATATFEAVPGNRQLFADDAGVIATFDWTDDAGEPLQVLERFTLMSTQRTSIFYKLCPQPLMSCNPGDEELWVRSFSMQTGDIVDDVRLAQSGSTSSVVEAALLDLTPFPPGVLTLVQLHSDAGDSAVLRLALAGSSDLACPLPPNSNIAGATIGDGKMWIYVQRDGGPFALEVYDLTGVNLAGIGWPEADSVSGQRRAR
jgi:hypothetical protein